MKLKLDENIPHSSLARLTELGLDVDTVLNEHLGGRPDADVWSAAQGGGRLLVTQDLDFSDTRNLAPGTHHGIVVVAAPRQRAVAHWRLSGCVVLDGRVAYLGTVFRGRNAQQGPCSPTGQRWGLTTRGLLGVRSRECSALRPTRAARVLSFLGVQQGFDPAPRTERPSSVSRTTIRVSPHADFPVPEGEIGRQERLSGHPGPLAGTVHVGGFRQGDGSIGGTGSRQGQGGRRMARVPELRLSRPP